VVTGPPVSVTVAVSVLAAAVDSSTQLLTCATPWELVITASDTGVPSPEATNVTCAFGNGVPSISFTRTAGLTFVAKPMSPVWPSPTKTSTLAGSLSTAVAPIASGDPVSGVPNRSAAACIPCAPRSAPSVQLVVASPSLSVSSEVGLTPAPAPPDVIEKSTVWPDTALPC
jgi:hypothetical protein